MNIALWIAQILLVLVFGYSALIKAPNRLNGRWSWG
jgi:hypothetical protein